MRTSIFSGLNQRRNWLNIRLFWALNHLSMVIFLLSSSAPPVSEFRSSGASTMPETDRHCSRGASREWNSLVHWSHGRAGLGWTCQPLRCLLFTSSPWTTKMNSSSPGWTIGGRRFPGVSTDSGLKWGRLQLVFESPLWGSALSSYCWRAPCKGRFAGALKGPFGWHVLTTGGDTWV